MLPSVIGGPTGCFSLGAMATRLLELGHYITGRMPTKQTQQQEHRWRIVRITATPGKLLGYVYAPDEETALKRAIAQFDVQRPWRNRLLAIRES